ncbi:MAG: hypothetical protein ACK5OB_04915 [Pirellula sp.]
MADISERSENREPTSARILYCHCAYAQVVPQETKQAVLEGLVQSGIEFDLVPDLCEMSARQDPLLESLSQRSGIRIAACYPRAVYGLFKAAGCPLPAAGPNVVNLRVLPPQEALKKLLDPSAVVEDGSAMDSSSDHDSTETDAGHAATLPGELQS